MKTLLAAFLCLQAVPVTAESGEDYSSEVDLEELSEEYDSETEEYESETNLEEEPVEETTSETDLALPEETEVIEESSMNTVIGYEIPMKPGISDDGMFYPGEPSDDDLIVYEYEEPKQNLLMSSANNAIVYYETAEEAGAALAEQLVKHEASPVVYVRFTDGTYSGWQEIARAVVAAAFVHDGRPEYGDFIKNQYYSWGCRMTPMSSVNYTGKISYSFEYLYTAEQEEELAVAIDQLLKDLDVWSLNSDLEKFTRVYTWMTGNITYDVENLYDNTYLLKHTAYAALINRTAVCQGYATLLYRMCLLMGIDCRYINGGNHAWNIVQIDGKYYYVDSTWDARIHPIDYKYYLRTRDNFTDHTFSSEFTTAEFLEKYPSGDSDLEYPVSERIPAEGIKWRDGTPDEFEFVEGERIRVFADVYPSTAYEGDVSYVMTGLTVTDGGYQLGNSSSEGKYIAVTPIRPGYFRARATGAGFTIEKTFNVVEPEPDPEMLLQINTNELVEVNASAVDPEGSQNFYGWSLDGSGDVKYPAYQKFTVDSSTTLYPVFVGYDEENALDVNARVNGKYVGNTNGVATFDVLVDGQYVKESATDFYKKYPIGTEFEIVNIDTADGYTFAGVSSKSSYGGTYANGSLSGRIVSGGVTDVSLVFVSDDYTGTSGNVAKDVSKPVVEEELTEVKAYTYNVEDRSSASEVFEGWIESAEDGSMGVSWGEPHYLDVNARVDGAFKGNTKDLAKFDVFINGEMAARQVTDYYKKWPVGTEVEIVNFNSEKYDFEGLSTTPGTSSHQVISDNPGQIGDDVTEMVLKLTKNVPSVALDVNILLDGKYKGSAAGVATFDVLVDGNKVLDDGYDFYKKFDVGSSVSVEDIVAADGYEFVGVASRGSYKGTIPVGALQGELQDGGVNDILLMFVSSH